MFNAVQAEILITDLGFIIIIWHIHLQYKENGQRRTLLIKLDGGLKTFAMLNMAPYSQV